MDPSIKTNGKDNSGQLDMSNKIKERNLIVNNKEGAVAFALSLQAKDNKLFHYINLHHTRDYLFESL